MDAESDSVRLIVDPAASTRAQDRELLDGEPGYEPARVESMHDALREDAVVSPLVDCEALAKQWAERALDDETPFVAQWAPMERVEANAEVRLAPAVVVRRRERASLIGYYDAMLQALRGPKAQAPLGLAQLVTAMEANERLAWLEQEGAASGEVLGADPLFPLPANPEQMRIMERLRATMAWSGRGSPGTARRKRRQSHSALLAQPWVLVTSQRRARGAAGQAAGRGALCPGHRPDRGYSSELEGSVKAMSNRYAGFDAAAQTPRAPAEQRRVELAARVETLTDPVRVLREARRRASHGAPRYAGTLGRSPGTARRRAATGLAADPGARRGRR